MPDDGCGEYEAPGGGVGTLTADCKTIGSVMMAECKSINHKKRSLLMFTDLSTLERLAGG